MPPSTLSRWETIFALAVPPSTNLPMRRQAMLECFQRFGLVPTYQALTDMLSAKLGSVFVGVEYIDIVHANITVPDASYPFGVVNVLYPWMSTVGHILIRVQKLASMTEGDFYNAMALIPPMLEPILPADKTYDWYRPGVNSVAITGGPSAGGIYLDEAANLDNHVFDV
jgi:hypothetical protein